MRSICDVSFQRSVSIITYLDFMVVVSIPIVSILFGIMKHSRNELLIALLILTAIFGLVALTHTDEILSLKLVIVIIYSVFSILGFLLFFFYTPPTMVNFIILSTMGNATLLIPGVFRFGIYLIGQLRKTKAAGSLEALSLIYLRIPWQVQEIRDAVKYSVFNNPRKEIIRSILNAQFVLSFLVNLIKMMHILAEVTINRKYLVNNYCPRFSLIWYERVAYFLTGGVLIWLICRGGFFPVL